MANHFRSSISTTPAAPADAARATYAKPGNLLTLGALLVPLLFGWVILARPYSPVRKIIYGALMALSALWMVNWLERPSGFTTAGSGATSAATPVTHWTFGTTHDQMRGSDQPYASVDSENQLQFDPPYDGGSTATLTIIPRGKEYHEVRLSVTKGQFFCTEGHQEVVILFDQGRSHSLKCEAADDGSQNYVALGNYHIGEDYRVENLVSDMKSAKSLTIEAPFYQAGRQQMTFDVSDYKEP